MPRYKQLLTQEVGMKADKEFLTCEDCLVASEDIKYQLEVLSLYEREDLDYPEMEVCYENSDGAEGFITVCLIDLAKRALERIRELEQQQEGI